MPPVSALDAVKVTLIVFSVLGTLRLLAQSYPNKPLSQAFLMLY